MEGPDLAIVDVETTGISASFHRIIEIAILRVSGGQITDTFSTLVDPERPIPPHIEVLTGIRNEDLQGAPLFEDIEERLLDLFRDAVFVAHNARFDYHFVKEEFRRRAISFSAPCLCTMRLSRRLFPEYRRHSLDALIDRFNLQGESRHRALGDASVLYRFLKELENRTPPDRLRSVVGELLRTPTLPPLLDERHLRSLPESPGVYVFYGEGGTPLYVGKSVNVRDRVYSHFSGGNGSAGGQRLRRQVQSIEAHPTSGETGALILESHLIKQLLPLYNRRSRYARTLVAARRSTNGEGYETVHLENVQRLYPSDMPSLLGLFKSLKAAKDALWEVAEQYALCPRLLGLEKGNGSCTHTRLGRCRGACGGLEPAHRYNLRFAMAFTHFQVSPWPFPGPVLVEESDPGRGGKEVFVVDKWCLMGAFRVDEDGKRPFPGPTAVFDLEIYRIIRQALTRPRRSMTVRQITGREMEALLSE